ncbi:hypothetical protein DNTS_029447 [Danionella cerebrum]|uniref:SET domain-containing protein n=1 Tax=Danionella cerebrum TaxID=2873325 RepID=A0A553QDY1_9TELE|nr:hypothetical protein DNTS_029447 [Danionella translucida]
MYRILTPFRTLRQVKDPSEDKLITDEEVLRSLHCLFACLLQNDLKNQTELLRLLPESTQTLYPAAQTEPRALSPCSVMLRTMGFSVERRTSSLRSAGTGVFLTGGRAPRGSVVAMYPGTIYQAGEPIFFQSIRNPFVFRCIDRILIDGNDKSISKIVYRSCSGRDRFGPLHLCDATWLTPHPLNPLAVGQYINNCSNGLLDLISPGLKQLTLQCLQGGHLMFFTERAANVCYQELDVPEEFPLELRQFLPNVNYRVDTRRLLRCVVLVSLRDINEGEELFSNYYTIVH